MSSTTIAFLVQTDGPLSALALAHRWGDEATGAPATQGWFPGPILFDFPLAQVSAWYSPENMARRGTGALQKRPEMPVCYLFPYPRSAEGGFQGLSPLGTAGREARSGEPSELWGVRGRSPRFLSRCMNVVRLVDDARCETHWRGAVLLGPGASPLSG